MNTKKTIQIFALLLVSIFANAASGSTPRVIAKPLNDYIEHYKNLAIIEMQRSKVPASITMAQAILESNWGNGTLAKEANNHFGIKCNNRWQGDCYEHIDDDFDENGKLKASDFRYYESIEASYHDHSDFLTTSPRYSKLFTYDMQDYVSWAMGLKAANYASDSLYAIKLIQTIEKYELYKLDGSFAPQSSEPALTVDTLIGPHEQSAKPAKKTIAKVAAKNNDELDEIIPESYQNAIHNSSNNDKNTVSPKTESLSYEEILMNLMRKARKSWNNLQNTTKPVLKETETFIERGGNATMKPMPRIIFVEERQVR